MSKGLNIRLMVSLLLLMGFAYVPWLRLLFQVTLEKLGLAALSEGALHLDKLGHLSLFYMLTLLSLYGLKLKRSRLVLIGLVFLAILDELVQGRFSYRSADIWDLFADILGILLGYMSIRYRSVYKRILKKLFPHATLYLYFILLKIKLKLIQLGLNRSKRI